MFIEQHQLRLTPNMSNLYLALTISSQKDMYEFFQTGFDR